MREKRVVGNGDSAHGHRAAGRGWAGFLAHRWPTAMGVAVAALTAFDLRVDAGFVSSLSAIVVLIALVYVGAAALDRRRSAWVVLLAGLPLALFVPPTSWANPSVVLLVAAAVFVALGVARGLLGRPGGLPLQTAGMAVFGATALAALYVDPELGGYLVAFALIGHAGWDAYHLLKDGVVARSYAEFCVIFDLLLGGAILLALA